MNKIKLSLIHSEATAITKLLSDYSLDGGKSKDLMTIQHSSLCMETYIILLKKTFIKYQDEKKITLTIAQSIALFKELGDWCQEFPSLYAECMSIRETIFKQLNDL